MSAAETRLNEEILQETIREARAWLAANPKRRQDDIARGTGYSRATISLILTNNYNAEDKTELCRAIRRFLDQPDGYEDAAANLKPVETPGFFATQAALEHAMYHRRIGIVAAKPGAGKTFAAREFCKSLPKFTLMFWTRHGMGSSKEFSAELLRLLLKRDRTEYSYLGRMTGEIIESLQSKPRFIIVNDAHRLQYGVWELACDIVEQANVGIGFIGHSGMLDEINRLSTSRRDHEYYDRVRDFSIITKFEHSITPDQAREVAAQFISGVTDDVPPFLADGVLFPSMRAITNTCLMARTIMTRRKTEPNVKLFRQALALCGSE